jgi:hypothetical protein
MCLCRRSMGALGRLGANADAISRCDAEPCEQSSALWGVPQRCGGDCDDDDGDDERTHGFLLVAIGGRRGMGSVPVQRGSAPGLIPEGCSGAYVGTRKAAGEKLAFWMRWSRVDSSVRRTTADGVLPRCSEPAAYRGVAITNDCARFLGCRQVPAGPTHLVPTR